MNYDALTKSISICTAAHMLQIKIHLRVYFHFCKTLVQQLHIPQNVLLFFNLKFALIKSHLFFRAACNLSKPFTTTETLAAPFNFTQQSLIITQRI